MKKIAFMGTTDFSVPILQRIIEDGYEVVLVVTQPDRPKGRKRVLTPPPVKKEAIKHNIPVYQPEKVRTDYQEILDYKPDLIVTAAYGQILPTDLLDAHTFGFIIFNASFLIIIIGGAPFSYVFLCGTMERWIGIMYLLYTVIA